MSLAVRQRSPHSPREHVFRTLVAGGVAGCFAKSTVAPFDRVKILLQAHNKHYKHLGVFSTVTSVINKEGLAGLFRGNGAQMVRIFPYAAIQFASYEHFKKIMRVRMNNSRLANLVSGSMAGMTAVLVTYPLDMIRARLAFQVAGEDVYLGIIHAIKVIVTKEGGVVALYRGIVPTMIGMVPYAGLSFFGFDTLKRLCLEKFPNLFGKPNPKSPDKLVLIIPAKLMCGGLAGAFAQTVSYPLDVARRKMQLAMMLPESHKFRGRKWYKTLVVVVQEHGVRRGLYRGLSVNYIKVTPMVAVSFSVYELMKQLLNLDTSPDR